MRREAKLEAVLRALLEKTRFVNFTAAQLAAWQTANDVLATPADDSEPVAVKPLEWRDHGPNSFPARTWSAQTPFGFYEIEEESASDTPRYRLEWHSYRFIIDEDSLEAAKAAAQEDYEQRILSALVSAPISEEAVEAVTMTAASIAAMVSEWYAGAEQTDIPANVIERRLRRFTSHPSSSISDEMVEAATLLLSEIDASSDINSIVGASNPLRSALQKLQAASLPAVERGPTHRHKKRGSGYVFIGIGKMQADNWQVSRDGLDRSIDMEEVAIYRSVDDGSLWVRPKGEFEDGRFETITAPLSHQETKEGE